SQRFHVQLRKLNFLNSIQKENTFKSLENIVLIIPISAEEAVSQKNENNMTKEQLVTIINSLLVSLLEIQKFKYTSLNN
ncbi:7386_t:CDS:2, partial [Diversispora eburnea]